MSDNGDLPRIAIVGAGPVGLEAAVRAAAGGHPFTLYEAAPHVAAHLREWAHVQLFSPWEIDVSDAVRARLAEAGREPPAGDACPTGGELVEAVFQPLAELPEIAPRLRLSTRVVRVGREGMVKSDEIGTGRRGERPFRLLLEAPDGREWTETADVVLDCTGTWAIPNSLGDGGIPAPGERALEHRITRRIPDIETAADRWAGRTTLLVGAGHSAQTAARDLAALAESHPGTRVVWALRGDDTTLGHIEDDPLPERARLTAEAGKLAVGGDPAVEPIRGVVVDGLAEADDGRIAVTLRGNDGSRRTVAVDRILSLTGSVGDHELYRQLQVHECYATSGPMKLAAALLGEGGGGGDCLEQESHGAETLVNPEPGFFLLGSKSYGRNNTFLMRVGWQQVEEVFGLLAG